MSILAPLEVRQKRLQTCMACPYQKKMLKKKVGLCTKCGCWIKLKVTYDKAKCPQGKWEENHESIE